MTYLVAAFYHFTRLDDLSRRQTQLLNACRSANIRGTILLAEEGINGTVSGPANGIESLVNLIKDWPEIGGLEVKYSHFESQAFKRIKVKIKDEIVAMRVPDVDPVHNGGVYVEPEDWNDLISRDDVLIVDTRNRFEFEIGRFKGAIDPGTDQFHEFPDWADQLRRAPEKPSAVAMYCTGGIRCEKATAYMRTIGFDEVYHLKGGVLKYLEVVPLDQSMWEGECFVFDDRVSLNHGLEKGEFEVCYGCQEPVSVEDQQDPSYEAGVSCPKCAATLSDIDRERYRERQRQIELAAARGEDHLRDDSTLSSRVGTDQ